MIPPAVLLAAVFPPASVLVTLPGAVPSAAVEPGTPPAGGLMTVAVRLNGVPRGEAVLLRAVSGAWCAPEADLRDWRLRVPGRADVEEDDVRYYCLDRFAGYRAHFDPEHVALELTLAAENMEATVRSAYAAPAALPAPAAWGAYLNYDLFANRWDHAGNGESQWSVALLGEAVHYNRWGSLEATFVARSRETHGAEEREVRRLETSWRTDLVERMETLTLGDAVGASGYWGRPVRFGGLRFASNFETRPGFVTTPHFSYTGQAEVPSVVDVFVNGARVQSVPVPGGPFEITDIPGFGTAGEARIVVTDVLGRQSVAHLPFLATHRQLRKGLSSYSFEAGALRTAIGGGGDEYGEAMGVVQYRYGLDDRVTGEVRCEWSESVGACGLGGSLGLGWLGVLSPSGALSNSPQGLAALGGVSFEHPSRDGLHGSATVQWAEAGFRQLGASGFVPPRRSLAGNVGTRLWSRVNGHVGYASQQFHDRPPSRVLLAGLGTSWAGWSASISAADQQGAVRGVSASVIVARTFGSNVNALAQGFGRDSGDDRSSSLRAQAQRALPEGPGYGWRVLAGSTSDPSAGSDRMEFGTAWQNDVVTVNAEAGRVHDVTALRLGLAGAVGVAEGAALAGRAIDRSFGLVRAPALAGLPVQVNSRTVAFVDESGAALLPRLAPYAPNVVRVDLDRAPLDLHVDSPVLRVTAGHRTGHLLDFGARRMRSALLQLVTPDGSPVPAGAEITVAGVKETFVVAENGEAFVQSAEEEARLSVAWNGAACALRIRLPRSPDTLPSLGAHVCAAE